MILLMAVGLLSSLLVFMPESTEAGCGCNQWCWDHGWTWGICGDGDTCICYNPRSGRRQVADDDALDQQRRDGGSRFDHKTFVIGDGN